jgi:IS30 family transposase
MNFIIVLPKSGNKSVIMVVIDRLSKYSHFCALQHPFTASIVDQKFMDNIFKLHGMHNSIVSDRGPTFTNNFWQNLFRLHGTQLHLNTTYHPQMNGHIEVFNKCLERYLRCFSYERKNQWSQWLPLVEWWYNTFYYTSTFMTPFEEIYGQKTPSFRTSI